MRIRTLVVIAVVVVAMFALGWVSFHRTDTEATIKIDTREIKEDTGKAIEKGKELIDEAQEAIDDGNSAEEGVGRESEP